MKKLLFLLLLLPTLVKAQNRIILMQNASLDPGEIVMAQGLYAIGDEPSILGKYYIWSDTTTKIPDGRFVVRSTGACSTCAFVMVVQERDTVITAQNYHTTARDIGRRLVMTNTNARTVTLMAIDSVNSTNPIWILDGAGNAGTNNITVQCADGINSGTSLIINSNGGVNGFARSGNKYRAE